MQKSTHTPEYALLCAALRRLREDAGLTQRQLAEKLGREHSFVWRIEHGERRLDLVEFYQLCQALGCDPASVYRDLVGEFRHQSWPSSV